MSVNGLKQIVEALVFASDAPISKKKLSEIIDDISEEEAETIIRELREEYERLKRGFTLQEVAGGYEFVTRPEQAIWVKRLLSDKRRTRLTRAGLEIAAVVAYRQPVTRTVIESIRGVDSGGALRTLLERNLIRIAGREKSPGRPLIYETTGEFLRYFGINSLDDLPGLEEIKDIIRHETERTGNTFEQLPFPGGDGGEEEMRPADKEREDKR